MRKVKQLYILLFLCVCLAFSCSCCNVTSHKGGIENCQYQNDEQLHISFNKYKDKESYVYLVLYITKSHFDTYKCNSLKKLLANEEFIKNNPKPTRTIIVKNGETTLPFDESLKNLCAYLVFYEGFEMTPDMFTVPDSLFEITNHSNYFGYIKF